MELANPPTLPEMEQAVADGLVRRVDHGGLSLFKYTQACVLERKWTPTTRAARGIVFDSDGNIVARPFPKFFNLGEMPETERENLPDCEYTVEDKLDGSLGIVFHHQGAWRCCTVGAFESEQAQYAQAELLPKCDFRGIPAVWTILAEIIYPENRIICDYGDRRELVLLAVIDRRDGAEILPSDLPQIATEMGMAYRAAFDGESVHHLDHRDNSEGYVIRYANGLRVKVKSPVYVQAHKLRDQVSPKNVLSMIRDGTADSIRAQLPDHIVGAFDDIHSTLVAQVESLEADATHLLSEYQSLLREGRGDFARAVSAEADPLVLPVVFAMLDKKDHRQVAIRAVRRTIGGQS